MATIYFSKHQLDDTVGFSVSSDVITLIVNQANGLVQMDGSANIDIGAGKQYLVNGSQHQHVEADITDLDHDDPEAIHDNVAAEINAIAEKTTLVDADLLLIEDSADSNNKKKVQRKNLIGGVKSVWIPASAMSPTYTSGCSFLIKTETTATRPDINGLYFDDTAIEYAQFDLVFPDGWNEGTITVKVHWTALAGTMTNVVSWKIQAVALSNDDTIDVAFGTAVEITDAAIAVEDEHITAESGAITIGGTPAKTDRIAFQIYRDPTDGDDNFDDDAILLGVELFYTEG